MSPDCPPTREVHMTMYTAQKCRSSTLLLSETIYPPALNVPAINYLFPLAAITDMLHYSTICGILHPLSDYLDRLFFGIQCSAGPTVYLMAVEEGRLRTQQRTLEPSST